MDSLFQLTKENEGEESDVDPQVREGWREVWRIWRTNKCGERERERGLG